MRTRYRIHETDAPHFITATIVEWLPVFTSSACCDIVVRAFAYARAQKGLKLFGWVILDSHLHAIVAGSDLSKTIGDLKKFTAHELLAQIEAEGRGWLLNQLAYYRAKHKTVSAPVALKSKALRAAASRILHPPTFY